MNTCKKLLALLLALAMVFAFAACGGNNNDDGDKEDNSTVEDTKPEETKADETEPEETEPQVTEPAIYGKWTMAFNINQYLDTVVIGETEMELAMPETQVALEMIMEIDEDGDFDWYYQVDEEALTSYCDEASVIAKDYFIAIYAEQGLSEADFEASFGMPVYDYAEYIVYSAADSVVATFDGMAMKGYCQLDGEKLMVSEDKETLADTTDSFTVAVEGGALTISEMGGDGADIIVLAIEMYGAKLPWVFEKQ